MRGYLSATVTSVRWSVSSGLILIRTFWAPMPDPTAVANRRHGARRRTSAGRTPRGMAFTFRPRRSRPRRGSHTRLVPLSAKLVFLRQPLQYRVRDTASDHKRPTCEILKQSIEVFSALSRGFPRAPARHRSQRVQRDQKRVVYSSSIFTLGVCRTRCYASRVAFMGDRRQSCMHRLSRAPNLSEHRVGYDACYIGDPLYFASDDHSIWAVVVMLVVHLVSCPPLIHLAIIC